MGKITDLLQFVSRIEYLSARMDEHYQLFSDMHNRLAELNENLVIFNGKSDMTISLIENLINNRDFLDELSLKISDSNDDYCKKLDVTKQLMNELHGLAGIIRAQFTEARKEKLDCDKIEQRQFDSVQRIEEGLLFLQSQMKELSNERQKNCAKSRKKVCRDQETSEGGHEDVPKRKGRRPKVDKEA